VLEVLVSQGGTKLVELSDLSLELINVFSYSVVLAVDKGVHVLLVLFREVDTALHHHELDEALVDKPVRDVFAFRQHQ